MARPRLIRFQYSLGGLAIFITLFMIWGGYHANRGWKQRAAEAVLRRHDGVVSWEGRDPRYLGNRLTTTYENVVHALWGERMRIVSVDVRSNLEPEVVEALIALPSFEDLAIQPCTYTSLERMKLYSNVYDGAKINVASGGLRRVLMQHKIKRVCLTACVLDADTCRAIAESPSIESLWLMHCELRDEGFAELLKHPRVRSLEFSFCQVTPEKLGELPGSTSIEKIVLVGTPVTKAFASFVGRSSNVTTLGVTHPGTNDEFIAQLGAHPSLVGLGVYGGTITDEAGKSLGKMPSLQTVGLPLRSLSDEEVNRLKTVKPTLSIIQQ